MNILVTYDVQTETLEGQRRLRKVARICTYYGQRVQNSVFECVFSEVQLLELKNKLHKIIDTTNDSIRLYYLNNSESRKTIVLGQQRGYNVENILLV